jgi:hypothetical protein
MAYDKTKLGLIAYGGNGFGLYRYTTTGDNKAAVQASGYFNASASQLNVGDRIMCSCSDGEMDRTIDSNDGTTVTTIAVT